MGEASLAEELRRIGTDHGLERIGFCSADVFVDTRTALIERKAAGLHATMQFTYRNPERSTDPGRALPNARSLVVGMLSYRRRPAAPSDGDEPTARIAEYVWEPHYADLRHALDAIAARLRVDGWRTRVLVDDNALVDRAAAHRAGLGWWGKNSNLLVPGKGSRFVLGSVVTDAPLGEDASPIDDQCGSCRRCIDSCPTDAIVDDGVIDSNRCLAWLVQATGVFPIEHRVALGDRIYGCDDCQATCPPNVTLDRDAPAPVTRGQVRVALSEMLELDDGALLERFGAWYIPGREPRYLRRNALVVLANTGEAADPRTRALVTRYVHSADPIERAHAVWAAHRLGFDDLVDAVADDPDERVRAEHRHASMQGSGAG